MPATAVKRSRPAASWRPTVSVMTMAASTSKPRATIRPGHRHLVDRHADGLQEGNRRQTGQGKDQGDNGGRAPTQGQEQHADDQRHADRHVGRQLAEAVEGVTALVEQQLDARSSRAAPASNSVNRRFHAAHPGIDLEIIVHANGNQHRGRAVGIGQAVAGLAHAAPHRGDVAHAHGRSVETGCDRNRLNALPGSRSRRQLRARDRSPCRAGGRRAPWRRPGQWRAPRCRPSVRARPGVADRSRPGSPRPAAPKSSTCLAPGRARKRSCRRSA